ncbi:MAG: hypothetical protein HY707_11165 [Ignavibacteriae bacterium]|nr:hypothetical protein [Ignavibacteriota bacterium]
MNKGYATLLARKFLQARCVALIFTALLLFAGCVRVPKESTILSQELTGMIRSAQAAHLALLDEYLGQRRERTKEFIERVWIPRFMTNAFKEVNILDSLAKRHDANLLAEKDVQQAREKEALIREFTEDAANVIEKRRAAMLSAVDEIGRMLQDSIVEHYELMLAVNQALTAHLQSAAEVTEVRDKLLSSLNINLQKLVPIDKINGVLEKILTYEGGVEDIKNIVNEAKEIIKEK